MSAIPGVGTALAVKGGAMVRRARKVKLEEALAEIDADVEKSREFIIRTMMGQWIDETETLRTTKMARGGRDYLLGVVDAEAEFMESVANELLTACCRIWMRKGNELTEAFGTAVFERYLNPFFKERRLFFFRRLERKKRKSEDGPLVPQFSQEDRKAAVDQYERLLRVLQARLRLRVAAGVDAADSLGPDPAAVRRDDQVRHGSTARHR